jgi:sugar phosphate isomerase/epimerase
MHLGIFAKTFNRPTLEEVLDAVASHGLRTVQFNFACAGLPSMPERIEPELAERIRSALMSRQISISAISGTFNIIHPIPEIRRDGLSRLRELASFCGPIGASVITLCTGTRDPDDMWRHHAENDSPEAWRDLTASLHEALTFAEEHDATFGIEPETNNVVDSAKKARRLLDEMRTSRLKIVMDPANLFRAGELHRMRDVLDEAFELLGRDIVIAHAKDLVEDGGLCHVAAGKGSLDYDHYVTWLRKINFKGAVILHGLAEEEVSGCVDFLRQKFASNT